MLSAHMDSIGLIATHIEKEGFVRFGKVGGLDLAAIYQLPVRFQNGVQGVIAVNEDQEGKSLKLNNLYVDIGAQNEDEAKTMVSVGDMAVFTAPTFAAGGKVVSPYLDNRVGCLVLLMALERIQSYTNDLYFVFSAQEEVGIRGAKTAAYAIDPDYGVAVDVTGSDDVPSSVHSCSSKLGGGAAIKVMDSSVICHPVMVAKLKELADQHKILSQNDVLKAGGTDAGSIHVTRLGVITGGISIPCRYIHTPTEMADCNDIRACAALVTALAESELPKV
jgi:endoglucanase